MPIATSLKRRHDEDQIKRIHQETLHKDEAFKRQAPQINNRLQEQVTQLKVEVNKIVKQGEERNNNHQAHIIEEVENARKILQKK